MVFVVQALQRLTIDLRNGTSAERTEIHRRAVLIFC